MKLQITTLLCATFIASFTLMSHHNGVAEEQNKDRTGAPGSSQPCTHCHTPVSGANTTSTITVYDGNGIAVSEYIPGTDYSVEFTVNDPVVGAAYGFQATAVHADGSNAGSFSNPGTNVQLEDVNGRHIVEQSDPHPSGVFTVTWSAPATGSGDVAFYMAGLAANLAYGNGGDSHQATAMSLTEAINESVNEIEVIHQPIASVDGISWTPHSSGSLNIYTLDGKICNSTVCLTGNNVFIPSSNELRGLQLVQFIPDDLVTKSVITWKVVIPN